MLPRRWRPRPSISKNRAAHTAEGFGRRPGNRNSLIHIWDDASSPCQQLGGKPVALPSQMEVLHGWTQEITTTPDRGSGSRSSLNSLR